MLDGGILLAASILAFTYYIFYKTNQGSIINQDIAIEMKEITPYKEKMD